MLVAYHEAQHRHSRNFVESGATPEKLDMMKNRFVTQDHNPHGVNVVTFFQRVVTRFEDYRRRNSTSKIIITQ